MDYKKNNNSKKPTVTEDNRTRDILKNLRKLSEEAQQQSAQNTNDGIKVNKNDEGYSQLITNINKFVGALQTDENSLIVYPSQNDVVFNGIISDLNNLKFQFRYNDQSGGLYVWVDSMLLTKDVVEKLAKLVVIKDQWKTYWNENIDQYAQKNQ